MNDDTIKCLIPHAPMVPFEPRATNYQMFISSFEPYEYTNWIDESMSWKETCYVGDWSPLVKFNVKGPDALNFFQSLSGFNAKKYDVGQAKHIVCTNNQGKVIGEGILMRYAEDELQFTGGVGVVWAIYKWFRGKHNAVGTVTTNDKFIFQVQGPKALSVLDKLTGENLREIGFMRFREIELCGVKVAFLRQGMSGEIGFELIGPGEKGPDVYDSILKAGQEFGIRRLGGVAKHVNHIEACFPTCILDYAPDAFNENDEDQKGFVEFLGPQSGHLNPQFFPKNGSVDSVADMFLSPVELGWGKTLTFDHEFPGCKILQEEIKSPKRSICTLEWNDDDVIDVYASLFRQGEPFEYMQFPRILMPNWDKVVMDGKTVGTSTSRCYSYYFRKMLSLCVIDTELTKPGTPVGIIWGNPGKAQKVIRATVASAPYKKDNRRIDLQTFKTK